ncbi:hypothetical protein JVT61DRAFT_4348 [Boletus reticuloceps]|uniref:Uncharacterized protein n=1 Tax=Boletus reticuloceps TaxID=495285 RepID=A0A8I2YLX3_9AGAM|nr:hypothetical protein JVT61DRAFT_4348 [Boletus reticuloceps]
MSSTGTSWPVVGSLVEALLGWGVNLTDDAHPSEPLLSVSSNAFVQENRAIYLHIECRNELGLGGIPDFQGPLALLKHIAEPEYAAIRNNTCCPCIHVFIAGPYISFGGSILTDRYSYQPFTNYIYLGGLPLTNHLYNTTRIFDVFQNALHKIRVKYMDCSVLRQARTAHVFSHILPICPTHPSPTLF